MKAYTDRLLPDMLIDVPADLSPTGKRENRHIEVIYREISRAGVLYRIWLDGLEDAVVVRDEKRVWTVCGR
jgi:hypothetical protein